ncbi:ParB/RepB/Spo0J family partition protein [Candidatus Bodocaedibacter vickermanii]|uniref:Putative chromosome-partitioning protein ParB n=1 Tax=Candidatus Bodocaedibacter vickermanii TaxID=2741701 RepID=A0A7L9RTW3_9PROT|nr:putative chromosome-partitioning protein ParB [Candidatus Paracaedibacteraceae bacterium 'Lake Konstanz']
MDKKKSGLGTGLSSLLGPEISSSSNSSGQDIFQVNVDHITPCPFQPRKHFSEVELDELANSIRQNGVLQPIIVRQTNEDSYEIIAGERRWRACKKAGLRFIPVIVKEASDKEVLHYAIIENIQRENLTPIEESESYEKLRCDYNYTHEELAQVLGKSRSYISNILRLNSLDDKIKEIVRSNGISAGHARALVGLSAAEQESFVQEIVHNSLSVRDTEQRIKSRKNLAPRTIPKRATKFEPYDDVDTLAVQSHLSEVLQSPVKISIINDKPTLTIECKNFEILDLCVEKLSVNSQKDMI